MGPPTVQQKYLAVLPHTLCSERIFVVIDFGRNYSMPSS
jgi:hypothetical protein